MSSVSAFGSLVCGWSGFRLLSVPLGPCLGGGGYWRASCPLSLHRSPPAGGYYLYLCMLVSPWVGYVVVSGVCGLGFLGLYY